MSKRGTIAIAVAAALLGGALGVVGASYVVQEGPPGEQGEPGEPGPRGPQGPPGESFDAQSELDDLSTGFDDLEARISDLEFDPVSDLDVSQLEQDVSSLERDVSDICFALQFDLDLNVFC